jgi:predicted aspartyl protease
MLNLPTMKHQLSEFEEIMDCYYRRDPVKEANRSTRFMVDKFNASVERTNAEIEAEHIELQGRFEAVRGLEDQIRSMDRKLEHEKSDPHDSVSVEAYNRCVNERNTLVQKHRKVVQAYKEKERAFNDRVHRRNREIALEKEQVEASKKDAEGIIEEYRRWIQEGGPERFFSDLNLFYASLHQKARDKEDSTGELRELIEKVRRMRSDLGAYAKEKQRMTENGLLLVQATLCGSEPSYMIIDIGASVVTITPELADVLGITKHIGEEIELSLPAGIRVKAPQLVIPCISLYGMETDYVKAVVLKETLVGVDGCLGLSFLNRFDFSIEKGREPQLLLKPSRQIEDTHRFDVFISHKSSDLSFARDVFDMLTHAGYKPFLSDMSIEKCGTTEYQKAIDSALGFAGHLVVICSSRENLESPWVEAEWRLFDGQKRAGKKRGNIIPVLCGDMTIENLPIALGRFQTISFHDPSWRTKLVNYLPRY